MVVRVCLIPVLATPPTEHATWGKFLTLSVPQFPDVQSGGDNNHKVVVRITGIKHTGVS